jgi:hypothetical protein
VVARELVSLSFQLFLAKEEGGGKYQPTQNNEATRQRDNKA